MWTAIQFFLTPKYAWTGLLHNHEYVKPKFRLNFLLAPAARIGLASL